MEIRDLTERMHTFVRSKGWYEPESKRPQTPRNLAISLSLEANEVLEHFQWQAELKDKAELASELAGKKGEYDLVYPKKKHPSFFDYMFESAANQLSRSVKEKAENWGGVSYLYHP